MPTREELKAEIMSKLEKLVDGVLASGEKPLTLTQIEELALGTGGEIETEITRKLLTQQTAQIDPQIPDCPGCGGRMHRKGNKKRYLHSRSGAMEIARSYFYCKTCRTGHFPPR